MTDHYEVLGLGQSATLSEIKRAFREKAKLLHPDITGVPASTEMSRLLDAYEVLSDRERRFQYDKVFHSVDAGKKDDKAFDYRSFLKEHSGDPEFRARLIFFDLFHFEENDAVAVWQAAGGLDFPLERFLGREDWMDCGFILAEELYIQNFVHEAFLLLVRLLAEERKQPYFKHFFEDVELFIKEIVRMRLRRAVSDELWVSDLRALLGLGFQPKEEARWLKSIGETLYRMGDGAGALHAFQEALSRDPKITFPQKIPARYRPE